MKALCVDSRLRFVETNVYRFSFHYHPHSPLSCCTIIYAAPSFRRVASFSSARETTANDVFRKAEPDRIGISHCLSHNVCKNYVSPAAKMLSDSSWSRTRNIGLHHEHVPDPFCFSAETKRYGRHIFPMIVITVPILRSKVSPDLRRIE